MVSREVEELLHQIQNPPQCHDLLKLHALKNFCHHFRAAANRVFKRMQNPQLNKREEFEIYPKSLEEKQQFLKSFNGFSKHNSRHLKYGHCGQGGHIVSQCADMERQVSLTVGGLC